MEVAAIDGGIGSTRLVSTTTVNVSILDVNNKVPVFEMGPEVRVMENENQGYFITKLTAKDPDRNARLRYTIDEFESVALNEDGRRLSAFPVLDLFELDSVNGDIRVGGLINREEVEIVKLAVQVEDLNAETEERQIATSVVEIKIDDVNDNSPIFSNDFYRAAVAENAPRGTHIVDISATDKDKNKTVIYSMEGPEQYLQYLEIDDETGEIMVGNRKIDREIIAWLNFTVRATDSGFPSRSNFVDVAIKVLDENDNSPIFRDEMTNLTVSEATDQGSVVARIKAYDADVGEFGKVTYFLDRRSSALGKFYIHPDTGELSVSERLDREEESKYNLIVEAYDNYQFGFTTGDSRHSFTQVIVQISDVNDEGPVFEEIDSGCVVVTEFHEMFEPILVIRASDADDPRTPNGRLKFGIKSGNDLGLFRLEAIDHKSAKVFPSRPLKSHFGNYSLNIEAQDGGSPSNRETARYNICVQVRKTNSY